MEIRNLGFPPLRNGLGQDIRCRQGQVSSNAEPGGRRKRAQSCFNQAFISIRCFNKNLGLVISNGLLFHSL